MPSFLLTISLLRTPYLFLSNDTLLRITPFLFLGLSMLFLLVAVFTIVAVVVLGIIVTVFAGADAVQYHAENVCLDRLAAVPNCS